MEKKKRVKREAHIYFNYIIVSLNLFMHRNVPMIKKI